MSRKTVGRVFVGGALCAGVASVLVAVAPMLLRDRVIGLVEAELDRRLGATVRFDDVSLSVVRHFPDVTVGVTGLVVTGEAPFEGVELVAVDELSLTFDLMSVVGGEQVELERLAIVRPRLHVVYDEDGRSNLDILPASDDAASSVDDGSTYALALRDYVVEDLGLVYEDRAADRRLAIEDLDHRGRAVITDARVSVGTRTDAAKVDLVDGGVALFRDVRLGWDLDADIDQSTGRITLRDNRLALNELALSATGTIDPGDELGLDLAFAAEETRFEALLSLIPAVYSDDFDAIESSGTLALSGEVRGALARDGETLPGFVVDLDVADGAFRYPDLPAVAGIAVDAHLEHPGGDPDLVTVDLRQFRMAVDGQPVEGSLKLRHPTSDPQVAARVVGALDLAKLGAALPSAGFTARGALDVDVDVAGKLSDFEAGNVDAVRATGTVRMTNVLYDDPEQAVPVQVDRLAMTLDPRRVDVTDLALRLGESDLSGTLQLDNLLAYLLSDEVLVGRAELRSERLDLDAIAGADEQTAQEEESSSLYVVPDDLDLDVGLNLAQVRYGARAYHDVRGRVLAKDGALRMDDLKLGVLDGSVTMNGLYRAEDDQGADVEIAVDVRDLGIAGAVSAFDTLKRLAPVAEKATGRFNTEIGARLRLGPDLTPDLASLFSDGSIELVGVTLRPAAMKSLAGQLKDHRFDSVAATRSAMRFHIENGRLQLDPTHLTVGGTTATLKGSTGTLDQTLDLRLELDLPVDRADAAGLLGGLTSGSVPAVVKIGGTYAQPKVSLDLGQALDQVADGLKQKLGAEVDAALDSALAAARAQGDALIEAAREQAQALVDEAKAQGAKLRATAAKEGDALIAEAKNPIAKKVAQEAAAKLVKEADKAATRLEREAVLAGEGLVAEATARRDSLIAEAETQAKAKTKAPRRR